MLRIWINTKIICVQTILIEKQQTIKTSFSLNDDIAVKYEYYSFIFKYWRGGPGGGGRGKEVLGSVYQITASSVLVNVFYESKFFFGKGNELEKGDDTNKRQEYYRNEERVWTLSKYR